MNIYITLEQRQLYHPDRFASLDLPAEMQDYVAAMARRINMAYEALETARAERIARAEKRAPAVAGAARAVPRNAPGQFAYAPAWKATN